MNSKYLGHQHELGVDNEGYRTASVLEPQILKHSLCPHRQNRLSGNDPLDMNHALGLVLAPDLVVRRSGRQRYEPSEHGARDLADVGLKFEITDLVNCC